ncbi:MAG: hypothetical protein AAGA69_03655 [Pseudomonadota bacterium]
MPRMIERTFDRAFVSIGIDARELKEEPNRNVIYLGLALMGAGGLILAAAIIANILG